MKHFAKFINIIIIINCFLINPNPLFSKEQDFNMVVQGGAGSYISTLTISPDSNYFISMTAANKTLQFWSIDGKLIKNIPTMGSVMSGAAFAPESDLFVLNNFSQLFLYSINGELLKEISPTYKKGITFTNFYGVPGVHPDNKQFAVGLYDNKGFGIGIYDFNGTQRKVIRGINSQVSSVFYSPDGKFLAAHTMDSLLQIYDKEYNLSKKITGYPVGLSYLDFTANSKLICSISYMGYSIVNTNGIHLKNVNRQMSGASAFSPDGKILATPFYKSATEIVMKLTDHNGNEVKILEGLPSMPIIVRYTPDGKNIIAGVMDGSLILWNLKSGKSARIAYSKDDWMMFTPDGYFDCSMNGNKIVAMIKGLDAFGIDQFALKYNRPDIILNRLGIGTKGQINYYRQLYNKRLKKAKLVNEDLSSDFHVPEVRINKIEIRRKIAKVDFELKDQKYHLSRYNIFVNDVPVFGVNGKEIIDKKELKTVETIELTTGENKIEITCFNEKGAESFRQMDYARYTDKVDNNLYFIGFGVSKYKNRKLNLKYAHKDVEDIAAVLRTLKGQYKNVYTRSYINEQVTVNNIKTAKSLLDSAKVDDTFILMIAGHGIHDETGTYYYLTHEGNVENLSETAADFELIEDLLNDIAPRNKLFLMDTCESGEQGDELESRFFQMADTRGIQARTAKIINKTSRRGLRLTKTAKRVYLLDKDRYIQNDLFRRSGAIVFSSSRGAEFSYEKDELKNGLFTEEIINALTSAKADTDKNGIISTDELRKYVIEKVSVISDNLQHPTVDRDNIYQKFGFPITKIN